MKNVKTVFHVLNIFRSFYKFINFVITFGTGRVTYIIKYEYPRHFNFTITITFAQLSITIHIQMCKNKSIYI